MTGRFDQKGDLWIEVEDIHLIPHGVVRSAFIRSVDGRFGQIAVGVAVTEINLTAYIADLVKNPPRR